MDSLITKAGETLVSLGLAGVVIFFSLVAIVALWRQNGAIQQARIDDAKAMAKIVEQNTVETRLTAKVVEQVAAQSAQQAQTVISEIRQSLREVGPGR